MKLQLFSLVLAATLAGPAVSGDVLADNPAAIAELMRNFGYRANLGTDDQGDPKIDSSSGGSNFSIYFYGCTNGKACDSIQFSSGFDLTKGSSLQVVNDWNRDKRYGKAYLDNEMDPFIEMDFNLDFGGISDENFRDSLDIWERLVGDFKKHINF
ncbi:YbjN domain-containing protein [Rhodobacter ferrooxidans]|uniref:YbjN domain-containing protein n=1 Tax=Rhodobacter ferrooxidans TaxID=371731 RepID=C8S2X9_9RHOB|nr:YbjN domain-containing protein [Rhodobacter sp. SW2]EEW24619.1 conserved hypothetical protein [Rhodobacter sp. SW2]